MSQLPKRKEPPDAYRPVIVPKAVKMINLRKHDERNEQEMIDSVKHLSTKPGKSIAHTTYETVYSSDLQRSAKWYYKAFGFHIMNINQDFGIVEILPGRILGINSTVDGPLKIGFFSKNMKALKRQLEKANVEIETADEQHLIVKDPDGNTIEIRGSGYGVEHVNGSAPDRHFRHMIRCRLETKDEMHLVARKITDDSELDLASEELISVCKREGISTEGEIFIVSEYSTEVKNIFACIAIAGASDSKLPKGMEYIKIPPHDYTIFPIDYSYIDTLRTSGFTRRTKFMEWSFTRPEGNYYILEHYKDDYIYISIPYYWNKGWDEQRRKREEELKNEKSEGVQR